MADKLTKFFGGLVFLTTLLLIVFLFVSGIPSVVQNITLFVFLFCFIAFINSAHRKKDGTGLFSIFAVIGSLIILVVAILIFMGIIKFNMAKLIKNPSSFYNQFKLALFGVVAVVAFTGISIVSNTISNHRSVKILRGIVILCFLLFLIFYALIIFGVVSSSDITSNLVLAFALLLIVGFAFVLVFDKITSFSKISQLEAKCEEFEDTILKLESDLSDARKEKAAADDRAAKFSQAISATASQQHYNATLQAMAMNSGAVENLSIGDTQEEEKISQTSAVSEVQDNFNPIPQLILDVPDSSSTSPSDIYSDATSEMTTDVSLAPNDVDDSVGYDTGGEATTEEVVPTDDVVVDDTVSVPVTEEGAVDDSVEYDTGGEATTEEVVPTDDVVVDDTVSVPVTEEGAVDDSVEYDTGGDSATEEVVPTDDVSVDNSISDSVAEGDVIDDSAEYDTENEVATEEVVPTDDVSVDNSVSDPVAEGEAVDDVASESVGQEEVTQESSDSNVVAALGEDVVSDSDNSPSHL